ncbi:MAG: type II toxin-antitoxin system HicB family antitoxin [Methylovulum miyakonense]|uniref:type II toxin-antitoxin system HicB family antitoxin n=1 Tax=Methylovulum miyakonense TaxID=645578 RepID=UPI003BB787B2
MTHFNYKGYQGSVKVSVEDHCLHGKIEFIGDLVNYEADTVSELEKEFRLAVDSYLETCKATGMEPKKPFKGSFNVRIGQELHEKAAKRASDIGKSLNEYIKDIVKTDTESHA